MSSQRPETGFRGFAASREALSPRAEISREAAKNAKGNRWFALLRTGSNILAKYCDPVPNRIPCCERDMEPPGKTAQGQDGGNNRVQPDAPLRGGFVVNAEHCSAKSGRILSTGSRGTFLGTTRSCGRQCLSLTVRNTIRHPRACGLAGYDVALTRRRSPVRIRSGPSILQRGRPKTPLPGGGRPLPVPPPRGDSRGKAVSAFLTPDSAQFFANVLRNALNHVDIRSQGTFGMCSTLQTGCRHTGLHLCHLPAQESLLLRQGGDLKHRNLYATKR